GSYWSCTFLNRAIQLLPGAPRVGRYPSLMIPLMSWLPLTFAPPCFAYASSSPDRVIGSEPTLLTTSAGLKPSLREFSLSSAVNAGMENETTTWAPAACSAATAGPTLTLVGS